jgi:uncharacterized protein YukE
VGEPTPIKEGGLPAGSPESYGGRDAIRQLLAATRPEEFGGVADAYQSTAALLDQAIGDLEDYASRLVADGDWGGASARAMLERMARMQSYLGTLRSRIDDIPPALQQAGRDLATAKEQFEQATEQRYSTVDTGSYISYEPSNDPDADAAEFMRQLNGRFAESYASLPDQLPWDATLASPAPYLPPASTGDSSTSPQAEGQVPASLAGSGPPSGPAAATPASTTAAPAPSAPSAPAAASAAAPLAGSAPGPSSAATERLVSVTPPAGVPTAPGTIAGTAPPARPGAPTLPQAAAPSGEPASPLVTSPPGRTGSDRPATLRPAGNPYTTGRDPGGDRSLSAGLREAGPTMRPGVVPVVGAAPPTPVPLAPDGAGGGPAGQAGMPFMPMGGGMGQDGTSHGHRAARPTDDSFFALPADPGHPVVD